MQCEFFPADGRFFPSGHLTRHRGRTLMEPVKKPFRLTTGNPRRPGRRGSGLLSPSLRQDQQTRFTAKTVSPKYARTSGTRRPRSRRLKAGPLRGTTPAQQASATSETGSQHSSVPKPEEAAPWAIRPGTSQVQGKDASAGRGSAAPEGGPPLGGHPAKTKPLVLPSRHARGVCTAARRAVPARHRPGGTSRAHSNRLLLTAAEAAKPVLPPHKRPLTRKNRIPRL